MTTVGGIFLIVIVVFSFYLYKVLSKSIGTIKSVQDFLSYGLDISQGTLEKTFVGSNASFLTAFVSLFFYVFFLGINTIWIPIGFIIGIIVFNYLFLPRLIVAFKEDYRMPEFITSDFSNKWIRASVGLFSIANLYLFTFTEIQGFHLFVKNFFEETAFLATLIPFLVVLIISLYTVYGGFRAVILTDGVQIWLIRVGGLCLLAFIIIQFSTNEIVLNKNVEEVDFNFLIATIFGFILSQLMYYDNWQRLSFFALQKSRLEDWSQEETSEKLKGLVKTIRRNYNLGALTLLLLYLLPIALGFLFYSKHPNFDFSNYSAPALLANFLESSLQLDFTFNGLVSVIFLVVMILFFFGALVTTADTYILGSVNILAEDILRLFSRKSRQMTLDPKYLQIIRLITLLFSLSFLFFVFIEPDFEKMYLFMFYSVNGIAGPLLLKTFKRRLHLASFITSLIFCFLYSLLNIFFGINPGAYISMEDSFLFDPGFVTILLSVFISFLGSKKQVA